jgi:2-amino-4-hydroxy-6-hydroxymethyldihydropteridine diphosphokinase
VLFTPPEPQVPLTAIALGSNLGDRRAHLEWAVDRLRELLSDLRVSSFIETEPVDMPGPQPPFLNGAAVGETALAPEALLGELLALERERGRERTGVRAPRTLDLDLLLHGDLIVDSPTLVIPHPRFAERAFVLEPLAEIAPQMRDPRTGKSVARLLGELRKSAVS